MIFFKHLSIALLLFLTTNLTIAQSYPQVEADYQKVLNEALSQDNPSTYRGHGLSDYYKALLAAGASEQYALNQTKIKFRQLKSTDIYAAFETLMKVPSAAMNPLRDELNSVEKEHVKALANWVIAGRKMENYPAGVPHPHKKAVTQTNQVQNTNTPSTQVIDNGTEDLKLGNEAYAKKDYKTAYDYFFKAEAKGNVSGIANIGLLYEFGYHLNKDLAKAIEYYDKAIEKDNKFSMYRKGYIMANNLQFKDDKKSFELFLASASENKDAANWLAYMYETGRGTDADFDKAMEWYKNAADQGIEYAKKRLENLPKDIASGNAYNNAAINATGVKAIKLFEQAYAKGSKEAPFNIGNRYLKGTEVPIDTIKAIEWFKKSAAMDYVEADRSLAKIYYTQKKYPESFEHRMKSAKSGDASSMNDIGYMYHLGQGTPKNLNEAFKWYAASADKGLGMAMHNVAVMYTYGEGTEKNLLAAKSWHEKAIAAGYKQSEDKLKEVEKLLNPSTATTNTTAANPTTTPKNPVVIPKEESLINDINRKGVELYNQKKYTEALPVLREAAGKNDPEALYLLGTMYDFGYGVTVNLDAAIMYYEDAEALGHKKATEMLDEIYYWGW
jgi:TPR repeat protein